MVPFIWARSTTVSGIRLVTLVVDRYHNTVVLCNLGRHTWHLVRLAAQRNKRDSNRRRVLMRDSNRRRVLKHLQSGVVVARIRSGFNEPTPLKQRPKTLVGLFVAGFDGLINVATCTVRTKARRQGSEGIMY
jgi:hypothetical protein